ncbi:MAG: hypothetical protein WC046_01000 [Candidatus Bathyarchaeia archaeon]
MSRQKKIKDCIDYCPQPQMPLTIRLKRHSLPIAVAVTATLIISVTLSIFYLGLATYTSPPPIINASNVSFYESAYARATSEQKVELDKIIADNSIGLVGEWRRPVLITIGDLPKDQPRLTAEQAGKIYDRIGKDESALEREFNKIAGAPDFVGGSGIGRSIYYLNDNRTDAIYVRLGDASHVVFSDDGTQTRLPLGNQKLPVNPGPSTSPDGLPTTLPILPSPTKAPAP